ncbi:MAG: hypothetical protein WCJ97_08215 [Phycisphaerae bacterium]
MRVVPAWLLLTCLASVALVPAWADRIVLQDGRVIEGRMRRLNAREMEINPRVGEPFTVMVEEVRSVSLTSDVTETQKAESRWAAMQARFRAMDKLPDIIKEHDAFITEFPTSDSARSARESREAYQRMQTGKYVKFRRNWVAPEQRDGLLREGRERSVPALDMYRAGKLREAVELAKSALTVDEGNPTALAIMGMVAVRQNQILLAREWFIHMTEFDPDSVLGWNNASVAALQLKREPEALLNFSKALQSGGDNRLVVDNVADFLGSYSGSKTLPSYISLTATYAQAETRMVALMAKQGLYRYGSSWVTKEERNNLDATAQLLYGKIRELDLQYRQNQLAYDSAVGQIESATRDWNTTVANINYYDTLIAQQRQQTGAIDVVLVNRRDAFYMDLQTIQQRRNDLILKRDQISDALKLMQVEAQQLKTDAEAFEKVRLTGAKRYLEPGEETSPPPPLPVTLPPGYTKLLDPGSGTPAPAPTPAPVRTGNPRNPP